MTQIADLREKFEEAEGRLNESKEIISTTESRWLPKLEQLVQDVSDKFSTYFDSTLSQGRSHARGPVTDSSILAC